MMTTFRIATIDDIRSLAAMNVCLIRDEGHRNPMTIEQLIQRMSQFLATGYDAAIFEQDQAPVGYALFRFDPDWVYLRQFYVKPEFRRQGIGRKAIEWLQSNCWNDHKRIRIDVLVGNQTGIDFWHGVGFVDYCLTMELDRRDGSAS